MDYGVHLLGAGTMIQPTEEQVDLALGRVRQGLLRYCWIQANLYKCDVSKNIGFQTQFNAFYRVRRNEAWRARYYVLMQNLKGKTGITFASVVRALKEGTGRVEASFASKLVATLDPTKPVIDRHVLHNFGLRLTYYVTSGMFTDRVTRVSQLYDQLAEKYEELLASSAGAMILNKFRARYPEAQITDLKKVDLVLWQIRD